MSRPAGCSKIALVTKASGYAGPGAVSALLEAGFSVFAQDASFADARIWKSFASGRAELHPIIADSPATIIADVQARADRIDAIVSNDQYRAVSHPPASADLGTFYANFEALMAFPFALVQAAMPIMAARGGGNIVLITSNRMRVPLQGAAFADAARAGANALVRSLAVDCASHAIIVNAIAPNFLYSEQFYPKAVYAETEAGKAYVRDNVPVGRLAQPEEIGEVIAFLASVQTRFLTGAIIDFSGGWPFGRPRPSG